VQPQKFKSMINSNDHTGSRTRDVSACISVSHPPHVPSLHTYITMLHNQEAHNFATFEIELRIFQ